MLKIVTVSLSAAGYYYVTVETEAEDNKLTYFHNQF